MNVSKMLIPYPKEKSQDVFVNDFEYALLDFCKTSDMVIVNGRVGSDRGTRKYTFKDVSVVDYVLISANAFHTRQKNLIFLTSVKCFQMFTAPW